MKSSTNSKKLLFTVGAADCEWETFTCGGKGGSGKDTSNNGVRCRHKASGAVAEARDTRSQLHNRRAAFRRMAETPEFKAWHKVESARRLGMPTIDELVDAAMEERNLRIEVRSEGGGYVAYREE